MNKKKLILLCATRRGYLFLDKLITLLPNDFDLIVFSFKEESWEPPFIDNIRDLTNSAGGKFYETRQVGAEEFAALWHDLTESLMLVVSWRYMLPTSVYEKISLGTYVFHDSYLPEYRGFSPTVWAVANGEDHTGVTSFKITEEVDAGDVVDQKRVLIDRKETIAEVMKKVTSTYLSILEDNFVGLINGTVNLKPQDHSRATYTRKREVSDSLIDWTKPASDIYNLIRAVTTPYPGAFTFYNGKKMIVWNAEIINNKEYLESDVGRVVEVRPGNGSVVSTGDGCVLLRDIQFEGEERICSSKVLNGANQIIGN